jgi:hypothetical protein
MRFSINDLQRQRKGPTTIKAALKRGIGVQADGRTVDLAHDHRPDNRLVQPVPVVPALSATSPLIVHTVYIGP